MIFKTRLSFKEASNEVLNIIQSSNSGALTIDAGSLGTVFLKIEDWSFKDVSTNQARSRIAGWLSILDLSARRGLVGANSNLKMITDRKTLPRLIHSRNPQVFAQIRASSKRKKK